MMLGQPDLIEAEFLGISSLRELLGIEIGEWHSPLGRISKWKQQSNIEILDDAHNDASSMTIGICRDRRTSRARMSRCGVLRFLAAVCSFLLLVKCEPNVHHR